MHPTLRLGLTRRLLLVLALAFFAASPASGGAQGHPASVSRWLDNCRESDRYDDDRARHCEVREAAVAQSTRSLGVDGRTNGSVRIMGWDRDSIAVFALVQTQAPTEATARSMAGEIRILTDGGRIRAEGEPEDRRRSAYAVSYHVYVPRQMDVQARTHNGGISVEGVAGTLDLEAHNGGLSMQNVGGDVRGRTRNGGITLRVAGAQWNGRGIDLQTTNGGVTAILPERFNGRLETSTVNGGFDIDFPVTLQGRIGRSISATLGSGGPLVRLVTTNGGVRIRRG